MTEQNVNVILADDHPVVLDGVKEIIKTMGWLNVVGTAGNGKDLLQLVRHTPVGLVILDINMPGSDGIECTKQIKREFRSVKVLVLTMYNDRGLINEMINAGADGCILKSKGSSELREAISRVMDGKSYFDFIPDLKHESLHDSHTLTEREIEVAKMIAKGRSSIEISDTLFISEHTVKTHRKNIFKKLDINTSSQLVQFAVSRGWI
jgi:DNA-binding NarL/FixJ family response regulator